MAMGLTLLLPLASLGLLPGSWAANNTPAGCGPSVLPLYYNLCSLGAVWGIVVEAFAAAGVVTTFLLLLVLLASLPFATDANRRSSAGLHFIFLVSTLGLFALAFAFIVGPDFSTCTSRRFLFGVLFTGCFSCLLMQGVRLSLLGRHDNGPRGWLLCLGALALWMVEVIINTEWLVVTVSRNPPANATPNTAEAACTLATPDFPMSLIYVMVLLLAALLAALPALAGRRREWRCEAAFILVSTILSVGIWVAWIVMYVYGNQQYGGPSWDDPTLAIALVANGWVFLILYIIPEICMLTNEGSAEPAYGEELYPTRGVGYETILKEQTSQNMFVDNKAFSMDEPNLVQNKPLSPYSGYNGQLRSSVYHPTELALITKPMSNMELSYDTVLPRATVMGSSPAHSSSTASCPPDDSNSGQQHATNGNGFHKQW